VLRVRRSTKSALHMFSFRKVRSSARLGGAGGAQSSINLY
jgi:hypothetical protein